MRWGFIVFLMAMMIASVAWADTPVTLRSSVEVNSSSIRLSDVFNGVPKEIDRPIAVAPAPGKSVTYDARVLTKLAETYRFDWQPESLADRLVLTRAATRISQDMIVAAVLEKLKGATIKGKAEVTLDQHGLEVNLPADCPASFVLNNFTYDELSRRFRADLTADTGAAPLVVTLTGRVFVKRDVPVLTKRLAGGTILGASDLDWLSVPDEHITADVVTEVSQVIGRELRHDMAESQPLHSRDIIPPRLVTRGGLVTLKIQTPALLMTAQGRALQDGVMGDVVRVTNTQSNRVVEGTVDGSGVVLVSAAQKLAQAR
jgi:flagellar basal body P-ring formation protein FlgA